jgi:hypothetical protein
LQTAFSAVHSAAVERGGMDGAEGRLQLGSGPIKDQGFPKV